MVNYLCDPETIEANHEAFAIDGTVVRSPDVDVLMAAATVPRYQGAPFSARPGPVSERSGEAV
jgi:malonyl-CoA decarboxylase